jgi:long-chain acyl-CoA synthetase
MSDKVMQAHPPMQSIDDIGVYTIPAILRNSIGRFADQPALSIVGKDPMTYRDLHREARRYAAILLDAGIRPGDRVALFAPSSPKWGIAYFAIVCIGAIAVPMLPDFNKTESDGIIRHSEACFAFVSKNNADKLADCDTSLRSIVVLEDESWVRGGPSDSPRLPEAVDLFETPVGEEDTASIIYTSGTTGTPKGVELLHRNIAFMANQVRLIQDIHPGDVFLSILPMSHVYEFTIGFIFPMMQGCHVSYLGRAVAVSSLLPALQEVKPNIMLSVPAVMEKIYKNRIVPSFSRNKLIAALYRIAPVRRLLHRVAGRKLMHTFGGNIRFFGLGGAKTQPDTERFLKEGGFPYAIGYGLTETAPLVAGANPKQTRLESTGPKLAGTEMKLIGVDPATGIGEIVTKGPHVMKGYYRNEELTRSVFTEDGFFKTGDNGYIDEDGYLFIKGRNKNVIIGPSGENIYPEDIEFVLNKHPLVLESLVVERDNRLIALVKLDESLLRAKVESSVHTPITEAEIPEEAITQSGILNDIRSFVNTQVNKFSQLKAIEHIADLEKTASQKIKRFLYNAGAKGKISDNEGKDDKK